ncbi:MAG TPA: M48 family metallopeptidase [Bdellovibrionales bacterium]|nr:M48 family metallopeptidase [Bdellovibrionales bacterium]
MGHRRGLLMEVRGWLFDGKSSARLEATVFGAGGQVRLRLEDGTETVYFKNRVLVSGRIGTIPRALTFEDGRRFETFDNDGIDRLFTSISIDGSVDRLERSSRTALTAAAFMIAFMIFGYFVIVPAVAGKLAPLVPQSGRTLISRQALDFFERTGLVAPSELDAAKTAELEGLFGELAATYPQLSLTFLSRKSRIGPNAFALPDGTILLTDELVKLAQNSSQIRAVLYHEIGHVVHHHSMKLLIESSAISVYLVVLTGGLDLTNLPLALLSSAYSRGFELEADDFAAAALKERGESPALLGEILGLMSKFHRDEPDAGPDFLSTHPHTGERIRRLKDTN